MTVELLFVEASTKATLTFVTVAFRVFSNFSRDSLMTVSRTFLFTVERES